MTETQKFTENIKQDTTLPSISTNQITDIRDRAQRLESFKYILYQKYPDELHNINKKHPSFFNNINQLSELLQILSKDNKSITKEQQSKAVEDYNSYAYQINNTLNKIKTEKKEFEENKINDAVNGELEFDEIKEEMYTEEQKEELKQFTKDLWEEFFPESNVDKFVKWTNNQDELEDYQKILIAPANGIENIIVGVASLFEMDTWDNIGTLTDLEYEDWCDLWKTLSYSYENLSSTDKVAPIISLIFSIGFLIGGVGKIGQLAEKLGASSKIINTIKIAGRGLNAPSVVDSGTKGAFIGTMAGITLPYIKK